MAPLVGRTAAGARFAVPPTADMFVTLASPWRWGPAELLTLALLLGSALGVLLRGVLPLPLYVAAFAFWRIAYNLGLGLLLRAQSRSRLLSRGVQRLSPSARGLANWFAARSVRGGYSWAAAPPELNAWVAFRALALVVLANDGAAYLALAVACFRPAAESSAVVLLACFSAGAALVVFSLWAKAAAHATLGDFAWYWGDFFFTVDGELVFDGVFRLFPHPMYTAGYAAYYGLSLIARSHVLFTVSVAAHVAQIAFLVLVEEPHIQRLYGPAAAANGAPRPADDEEITPTPLGPAARVAHMCSSAHLAPAAAVATAGALLALARPRRAVVAALAAAWRLLHWAGLGSLLALQATGRVWTRRYAHRKHSADVAFAAWRHTWALSTALNHALFVWLALAESAPSDAAWLILPSPRAASRLAGAAALLLVAGYAELSAYATVGDFGFFYGDFFLPPRTKEPTYDGVFRFVNHPSAALGYAAYYALALWRRSSLLFVFAMASQALHWMFIRRVEVPHMRRVYTEVRPASEFSLATAGQLSRLLVAVPFLGAARNSLARSGSKCMARFRERAEKKMVMVQDEMLKLYLRAMQRIHGLVRKQNVADAASQLGTGVLARISSVDSDDIMLKLRKFGFSVEPISDGSSDFEEDMPSTNMKKHN